MEVRSAVADRESLRGAWWERSVAEMSHLSSLKGKLLAEQAEEQLYQFILEEPISVGEKLPNEFALGERFGVGRSTIREAVKSLASKGIVEVRRGSGTYVVGTVLPEEDPLGIQGFEDKGAIALDLADVRLMIEPAMAEMAALKATEEDVRRLKQLCDRVESRIAEGESYVRDDIAFHCCVAECSKNKIMEQLIPIIDTAVMMFVNITHRMLTEETVRTHREVVNAIADHDPVGARTAMTMHMGYNREIIKRAKQEMADEGNKKEEVGEG